MTSEMINGLMVGTIVCLKQTPKEGVGHWATVVGPSRQAWCVRLEDGSLYDIDSADLCHLISTEDSLPAA